MRLKQYENKPVRLTYRRNGHANVIHGIVTNVGKDFILFLEWHGKKEMPVNKKLIKEIEIVKK